VYHTHRSLKKARHDLPEGGGLHGLCLFSHVTEVSQNAVRLVTKVQLHPVARQTLELLVDEIGALLGQHVVVYHIDAADH